MQIVTGRRGEPHVTSRQMQAVYRSFLGDFALLDIGEKLRAEAYSNDIVRVYDGVVSVQGIYAVIAYNQYDEIYIEPVSVGKKRIDTIVLHYTKDNALDVEDMQLDVVQGDEYTDNPIAPVVPEGGDAWEGTTDIQVPIYDVEVTNFGLTVTPHTRMLTVIPTLDSIAERIPETVVTGVKGDSEVLYRDGDVNITKANIGLGNVDNTADTDKPVSTATQTALNLKADLTYVDAKIAAAYHAGGSKTVAELTSALLIADNIGKVYNMSDSGVTTSDFVEGAGKSIIEGDNVGVCNVGTEESPVYKFDLLSGFVDLSAYATTSAVNAGLEGKVDKVTGKGLSTEDYTTTDKTKLAGISEGATQTIANPADTATETLSKLKVGGVVYDIPQGASGATELSELTDVNLSNVDDGDILQYDETANKWKNSNAIQGSKTATGNPITIADAAPVNAVNLSMDLEPIQDLHGYDNPWVGGAGKNKLPVTGSDETVSGVTYTKLLDNDSNVTGIKCVGTISGTSAKYLSTNGTLPAGTYVLTGGSGVSSAGIRLVANYTESGTNKYREVTSEQGVTFSLNTETQLTFYLRGEQANLAVDTVIYPMIRLSSITDPTFEPYSNICSISGRSEVAIQRDGVNQWDNSDTENGYIDSDGTVAPYTGYASLNYKKIIAGETYVLSFNRSNAVSNDGMRIAWYTADKQFIQRDGTSEGRSAGFKTFEAIAPTNAVYARASINITNATNIKFYLGSTYTIQIGQDVYGCQYDVTRGKMVVDKALAEFDGSSDEDWGLSGGGGMRVYTYQIASLIKKPTTVTELIGVISSQFEEKLSSQTYVGVPGISVDSGSGMVGISNGTAMNVNDWRTYLASNPLQVVYELATPFTIDLTPQQIKLLENTNTIYTDYERDTIHIEYQPNNAIGEAVRAVEESYDVEFAVRPVLKKKAFSGTTDSDGSVTLINASDIPSNHRIIPLHITDMTIGGSAGTYFVEYKPYNSGDSVKAYCYSYFNGSQITPVGSAVTGIFYYYELEV